MWFGWIPHISIEVSWEQRLIMAHSWCTVSLHKKKKKIL